MTVRDDTPHNLEEMLDRLEEHTVESERVSVETMLNTVGRRSFGPIILLAGLIPASPLSGIPGVPSFCGILVLLVSLQLVLGQKYFWMPNWVLRRSVARSDLVRALEFLRRPARWVDRLLHTRFEWLTNGTASYLIAWFCIFIGLLMPPLEVIPFANTISGVALSIFGLALISHDGLLVILGMAVTGVAFYMAITGLL